MYQMEELFLIQWQQAMRIISFSPLEEVKLFFVTKRLTLFNDLLKYIFYTIILHTKNVILPRIR